MGSVLLLSGGLDSLVLLANECSRLETPHCLSFDYGQRHRRELECAEILAKFYRVRHQVLSLPPEAFGLSALTGGLDLPKGLHYGDPGQSATVVPNRNMVFLSLAAAIAKGIGADSVLFAAHAGDAAVYADCRPSFVGAIDCACRFACGVGVSAPFIAMTKGDIVRLGRDLGAPLGLSWSCYEDGLTPCGECGACVERAEALGQ